MARIELFGTEAACSGCGACMAVCPKQAITMEENSWGCRFPVIQEDRCIGCGKCREICGFQNPLQRHVPLAAYAAVGTREELVKDSASGGIFASVAAGCMAQGGMVAGAVMEQNTVAVYHLLSNDMEDLTKMQGSKYVQSDAWRCYGQLRDVLREGKTVLFSGTPCQVAAVKRLTGDPENLVTMDIACHGVPPVRMLQEFMNLLSKRFGRSVSRIRFRNKRIPKPYCARITLAGKKERDVYLRSHFLSFYKYFLESVICRESCYSCPYAAQERISDITVGDFWGVDVFHGQDMQQGTMPARRDWSCVLVNTEKGKKFLEAQSQMLALYPSRREWVYSKNGQFNRPVEKPEYREKLLQLYAQGGYRAIEKAFIKRSGGSLRFYWRMWKDIWKNRKVVNHTEKIL